jgi:hypothetical protein
MRIYGIHRDGQFTEYKQTPFELEHQEKVLEEWLEANPKEIVEHGSLMIIGRQVRTDLSTFIDLLALDQQGNLVVMELKRDRTPRDTLAQALEYAAFAMRLDAGQVEMILRSYVGDESASLADYHREYFQLSSEDAVAFNKDQRIVIVGQSIAPEIRQTATFLAVKGIQVTCIEFAFFQAADGTPILSQEVVVGQEAARLGQVTSGGRAADSELRLLQYRYWSEFASFLKGKDTPLKVRKPLAQHWMDFSLGRSDAWLSAIIYIKKGTMWAGLCCQADCFSRLQGQRADIERELGQALLWDAVPGRKSAYIGLEQKADLGSSEQRQGQFAWVQCQLEGLLKVFQQRLLAPAGSD